METFLPTTEKFDVRLYVFHPQGLNIPLNDRIISIESEKLGNEAYLPLQRKLVSLISSTIWYHPKVYFGIFNDDLIFTDGWLESVVDALNTYNCVTPGYINTTDPIKLLTAKEITKDNTGVVEFFMGACALMKMDIFLRIGMLDPQFDWSMDDFDLLWRMRLNGLKSVTLKKITIAHAHGTTRNRDIKRWYRAAEEGKRVFCDKYGAMALKEIRSIYKGHRYFLNFEADCLSKLTEDYWDGVWGKWRHDDKTSFIKATYDRANSPDYWDLIWSNPKRRYEKYSMHMAWRKIKELGVKSVLDVGCGNGRLLYGIKDQCECFGIDISSVAIARMRKEFNIDGLAMNVYDLDKLDRKFDFVVMNHTLEHIIKDQEALEKCKSVLNPGGHIFIAVPNNISGPEETEEHIRKYNGNTLKVLVDSVFGNCEISHLGNHLFAYAKNN